MPKADALKVINSRTNGKLHASTGGAIYSGDGMADTLDGYDASKQPGPSLIPVALADGKLDPGWLPEQTTSGAGASATGGQVYVAPWVRLARAISATDTTIYLNGNIHAVGDQAILGHYQYGNEGIAITGGPTQQGTLYEYTITRAAAARAYPAGSTVVFNLGGESDGGFVTIVSGDQQQSLTAPHINLFAYEGGATVRKVRIGRLQGLSAGEKAQFPKVDDWNVYGLYADAAYLRGQIVADSGDIAGDLDVGGTLGVWSGLGRAGVVLGNSEGGHGITLQNREGRPVFGAVSPYEDESGILSDVAVWIENKGEKGLYYHLDPATNEYRLEIGVDTLVDGTLTAANILAGTGAYPGAFTGMRFGAEGLQSYGTDYLEQVSIDVQDGRLYFGRREGWLSEDGITIDARLFPADIDDMEHTITWLHNSAYAPTYIGAAVGSQATGEIFMTTRRLMLDGGTPGAWTTNDFSEARLTLRAFDTSSLAGETVEIYGRLGAAMRAGDYDYATLAPGGRFSTTSLTAGPIHTSDDGQSLLVGTNSATGARLISQSDTVAAFRGQRSDGQYIALTPTAVAESWISASGAIVLAPNIGQPARSVLPATGSVSLGTAARPWGDVFATRLHGTVGSQVAIADNSSMYLTRQTMTLGVNLEAENVIAYATQSDLPVGDFIQFEDVDGNQETIRINTVGAGAGDWYEYEVERAQATGETPLLWYAGTVGVSLGGNATDGYIRLFGTDDLNPATGPSIVIYQRENDDAPESVSERAVFGNLSGWYHYADNADLYGVAFGRKSGAWASMDEANGLRMFWNETQLAQYGEAIDIGQPDAAHLHIDADDVTLYAGPTPVIELLGSGDANITGTLAVATGGAITWAVPGGSGEIYSGGIRFEIVGTNDAYHLSEESATFTYEQTALHVTSYTGFAIEAISHSDEATISAYNDSTYSIGVQATANREGSVGLKASGTGTNGYAILIDGLFNANDYQLINLADATADTDALNRQTGDGRYLLQTGTATGATSQAQAFTNGIIGPNWKPASNSTTALQMQQADGTAIVTVDTTNKRVGIGGTPSHQFEIVNGSASQNALKITAAAAQSSYLVLVNNSAASPLFGIDELGRFRMGTTAAWSNKFVIDTADSISNSVTQALMYARNTNSGGSGHAGIMLDRGSEAAVASFGFLTAGVNSFEIGDYSNHLFLRDIKGTYVFFARFAHGIPADTIYGASTYMRFNDGGNDYDVIIEGDTDASLFFSDASTDRIGIGTASPGYKLDVAGGINVSTGNVYRVAGTQVVGAQGAAVADASGGATVDAEARTAINDLLARMRAHGLIAT